MGGGSGGHVTPVVAVLKELRKRHPRVELRVWVDRKFAPQARGIIEGFDASIPVETIVAGKFRRYYHLTLMQHLLWPTLVLKNVRDAFLVVGGIFQSLWKLLWWRPDVVFTKGGYVCLPVGIAARILGIPLVIHDSDAHPGLTNRVLSRWATKIATGAPLEYYDYPRSRSKYVGIPIDPAFHPYSPTDQWDAKREWGIDPDRPLVVITGGGLGAQQLNEAVVKSLKKLQQQASVVLVSGVGQYEALKVLVPKNSEHFQLHPFVNKMASLLGAADVVVTRAGATTLLELAALGKPTIIIPNAALTGGHQLKNAAVYEEAQVAMVIQEAQLDEDPDLLVKAVKTYLTDVKTTVSMAKRFAQFAKPHAADDMARMILSARK